MAQQLKFVLTPAEAAAIDVFSPANYQKLREDATILAQARISRVQDVAIGLASSYRIYIGVNVEFAGLPLHHSISAEQFLVTNLALRSERELRACLPPYRFILESFEQDVPHLLVPQDNRLALSGPVSEHYSHLTCWALTAANRSYPKYSNCPSGVTLFCEGEFYTGWYIESVDYNLSVGPLQAALVDFVARGDGKRFENITKAVLVEMNGANVSQEAMARTLLKAIAPECDFKVFHCHKTEEN